MHRVIGLMLSCVMVGGVTMVGLMAQDEPVVEVYKSPT